MSFLIDISDAERAYLEGVALSLEAKERVKQFVEQFIANVSDEFRLNPENRPNPDSPYFLAELILLDRWGDGRAHRVDFHIRDDKAQFGVLLIVFIDFQ